MQYLNIIFSCGPNSYFSVFCNLIGYASGPYEAARTARDFALKQAEEWRHI